MQEATSSNLVFSTKIKDLFSFEQVFLFAILKMPFTVYIIYSEKLDRYYVGYSEDIEIRLLQHNTGMSTFTAKATDWRVVYTEDYTTREEAHLRELVIKRKKSRKYIEYLIGK